MLKNIFIIPNGPLVANTLEEKKEMTFFTIAFKSIMLFLQLLFKWTIFTDETVIACRRCFGSLLKTLRQFPNGVLKSNMGSF